MSSIKAWDGATEVQRQGGILTPVEAPVVTGDEGGQYGYDDFWDENGVYQVPVLRGLDRAAHLVRRLEQGLRERVAGQVPVRSRRPTPPSHDQRSARFPGCKPR